MRNLEDVKRHIQQMIVSYSNELELWKKVKILKKKDGNDYSVRSKSFENAKWVIPNYMDDLHPELEVTGRNSEGRWESFRIYMYKYTDELPDSDERKTKGKTYGMSRPTYVFTPDEAYMAIKDRITMTEKHVSDLQAQLRVADDVYNKFFDKIKGALRDLKNDCVSYGLRDADDKSPTSLEFTILDVLTNIGYSELR